MSPNCPTGTVKGTTIWKRFRPDQRGSVVRFQAARMAQRVRGDEPEYSWALRDINFLAEPGDAVGLVGNNGSGKSTLLKVLARVMVPHAGRVDIVGRVGALIEVKSGINPELTGRENVALYGTLLGLSRAMVASRFDAIVAFAQLEDAIDRQVKYYSSGMQMRLGFAVAAYLEPDILLVDEVLAVGDAAFQQRCLDRMRVVLAQGTTLVFVSHDLAAVDAVTTKGLWLRKGMVAADGPIHDVLAAYRSEIEEVASASADLVSGPVRVEGLTVTNPAGGGPQTQQPLDITFGVTFNSPIRTDGRIHIGISEGTHDPIFSLQRIGPLDANARVVRCSLARLPLPRGRFFVWVGVFDQSTGAELMTWQPVGSFDVFGPNLDAPPTAVMRRAPVHVDATWDYAVDDVPSEVAVPAAHGSNGNGTPAPPAPTTKGSDARRVRRGRTRAGDGIVRPT